MFRNVFVRLHRDEQGIEAIQAVLVMAIGAIVVTAIKAKWPTIKKFFNATVDTLVSFED